MYKKDTHGGWKHLDFLLIDIFCLHIAFVLAYLIKHGEWNLYARPDYCSIAIIMTLIDVLVAFLFDSFKNVLKRGYYKEMIMTIRQALLIELIITFYLFTTRQGLIYSRLVFGLMGIFYVILGYLGRILWKFVLRKKREEGKKRSLLVITCDGMKEEVVGNLHSQGYAMYHICGAVILDKDLEGQSINKIPIVASVENVADYVCRRWVDEVLLVFPMGYMVPTELLDQFVEMGVVVHSMISHQSKWMAQKQIVERFGGYTVLTTSINRATTPQLFAKRLLDIVVSFFGCIFTGILFLFIAPMIYLKSPGPIFFSQIRVGKNGKKFKMYKFRSMYPDAEERKQELMDQNQMQDGKMFKVKYDPRIIGCRINADGTVKKGIGNFLRDSSLDEFPQFFNVLKGDMSLVGTRPPTVDEWEQYDYHHRARLAVKPGVTGMWQVNGRSEITDFEEVVNLDMRYIVEWSMGLDLRILFKTLGVVLGKVGSM